MQHCSDPRTVVRKRAVEVQCARDRDGEHLDAVPHEGGVPERDVEEPPLIGVVAAPG